MAYFDTIKINHETNIRTWYGHVQWAGRNTRRSITLNSDWRDGLALRQFAACLLLRIWRPLWSLGAHTCGVHSNRHTQNYINSTKLKYLWKRRGHKRNIGAPVVLIIFNFHNWSLSRLKLYYFLYCVSVHLFSYPMLLFQSFPCNSAPLILRAG